MAFNSISIKPYIKSHLELQREITLIELAPSPYFFVFSICLAYMNMFARFDENPAMTLQDIKETKCYGPTHACRYGRENSIPHHKQSLRGVFKILRKQNVTDRRTHSCTDARTDVKIVYPTTNKVCGGYKQKQSDLGLHCLFGHFWQATCVQNFRTSTIIIEEDVQTVYDLFIGWRYP